MVTEAWPRKVERALALTPAAIISEAKVWRHSWRPTGSRSAARQVLVARWLGDWVENGRAFGWPKKRPPRRPRARRCSSRCFLSAAGTGTVRRPERLLGATRPSLGSQLHCTRITLAVEVDELVGERLELAGAEAGVHGRGPDRA